MALKQSNSDQISIVGDSVQTQQETHLSPNILEGMMHTI